MKGDIKELVRNCEVCQVNKHENLCPASVLQPLPTPNQAWEEISMDFVDGLPLFQRANVILVFIDRFTKYSHEMTLSHSYIATGVAQVFLKEVFMLHEFPKAIISDRDPTFLSSF